MRLPWASGPDRRLGQAAVGVVADQAEACVEDGANKTGHVLPEILKLRCEGAVPGHDRVVQRQRSTEPKDPAAKHSREIVIDGAVTNRVSGPRSDQVHAATGAKGEIVAERAVEQAKVGPGVPNSAAGAVRRVVANRAARDRQGAIPVSNAAAVVRGRIAADRAAGHRDVGAMVMVVEIPPPLPPAELPLIVLSVTVALLPVRIPK